MRKTHMIAIGVSVLVVVLLAGGAFGFWHYKHHQKSQSTAVAASDTGGNVLDLNTGNANSGATPLSEQQQNAANTEAGNNQGNSLQTNLGQQPSGSASSSPKQLDPSTFKQYDQYINATAARYAELKTGDGDTAVPGKTAYVVYKGWLTNGTLFDQSQTDPKSGKLVAFSFALSDGSQPSSVIAGWQQGINGMKVGGERLLIVPPAVGYGSTAHPPIPANSVLVFDVLLVAVK